MARLVIGAGRAVVISIPQSRRGQAALTDENMQELNGRVDLDGQSPAEVAKAYLTENGLLPGG